MSFRGLVAFGMCSGYEIEVVMFFLSTVGRFMVDGQQFRLFVVALMN